MLLYGDTPSGEPTLELVRRPIPADDDPCVVAHDILERVLDRWGWTRAVEPAEACVDALLSSLGGDEAAAVELIAFRRAHQVTVEVHYSGRSHVRETAPVADAEAALWGVRPLQDGEAVWFEFH